MTPRQVQWYDDRFYKVPLPDVFKTEEDANTAATPHRKSGVTAYVVPAETGFAVDVYLPSVTTVLGVVGKPQLARWRGEVGNWEADRIMHEAQDRGSAIHHACYTYINKGAVLLNPKYAPNYNREEIDAIAAEHNHLVAVLDAQEDFLQVLRFVRLLDLVKPEILGSEETLFSVSERVAGTMDQAWRIKGGSYAINGAKPLKLEEGIYIVDLKTGKSVDESYDMQIAAYAKMYEERGSEVRGGLLVHTNAQTRTGIEGLATRLTTREEIEENYRDFSYTRELWFRKYRQSPKVFDLPTILSIN